MKKFYLFAAMILAGCLCRAQWEPDVQLTTNTEHGGSWTSINNQWCVAASGDTVHVVWYDSRNLDDEIYYKHSTDGGISWGDDVRLTNSTGMSIRPCISLSGSTVHIAWCDLRDGNYEIYYKRSTDRGSTWGDDIRLTVYSGNSFNPSIAVNGLTVNIIWYDNRDGNWEIYYKRSTDGGITWGPDTRLTNDPTNSYNTSIAVSGSMVHVVWGEYRDGPTGEIYYKRSSDGGLSWGQDIRLTNDPDSSRRPCIAVSESVVHVVWYDYLYGNNEIFYKRSEDGGTTWGQDTRLTNSIGSSINPSIAVSGSAVHVVWDDQRDGNQEIYYNKSEDKGINWGTDTRLTDNSWISEYPSIAISGPVIHVVWTDYRNGGWMDIFYKRDPTDGFAVGIENESGIGEGQELYVYPNPSTSAFTFRLKTDSKERVTIQIFDLIGIMLQEYASLSSDAETNVGENLEPGIFMVVVSQGTFRKAVKIIKAR